jgi:DNA-binding NtrC family response regulator
MELRMNGSLHTVLIVTDDRQASSLLEEVLRPRNLRLFVAPGAAPALEICERESVHLVISDLGTPAKDRTRFLESLLRLQPEARTLLIFRTDAPPEVPSDRVRFLRKPFFPSQLMEQVEPLLPNRRARLTRVAIPI